MAYATTNPPAQLVQGIGSAPSLWVYKSTDAHGTVAGTGYFTNAASLGMKAHDVMIVVDTDSTTCTIHGVNVTDVTTINAATLA